MMTIGSRGASARVGIGIGAVMVGLGVFIIARLLLAGRAPLTGKSWFDGAFGVFFIVRGVVQYGRWRRSARSGSAQG